MAADGIASKGPPGSPPVPLRFVNLDGANLGRDASTKKIVRSHVMQRYRRGKAMKTPSPLPSPPVWKDRKPPSSPQLVLEEVLGRLQRAGYSCQCSRPQVSLSRRRSSTGASALANFSMEESRPAPLFTVCPNCEGCIRATAEIAFDTGPNTIMGAAKTDPFNTLPLNDQNQSFYLLDHYSHVVLNLSLPMNEEQIKWFKRVVADEVLLHSLLLYAAKHNEILTGTSREVEIYCHRGEVMRIVNERIGSAHTKLVDTTIDGVASLILFEEMFGAHDIANAHRAGLEQLLSLRGGLESFGADSHLHRLVRWARAKPCPQPIWTMVDLGVLPSSSGTFMDPQIPPLHFSLYATSPNILFEQLPVIQMELFVRLRNSSILVSASHSRPPKGQKSFNSSSVSSSTGSQSHSSLAAHLESNEQYILKARLCEELEFQHSLNASDRHMAWLIAAVLYTSRVLSNSLNALSPQEQHFLIEKLVDGIQITLLAEVPPSILNLEQQNPKGNTNGNFDSGKFYAPSVMLWMLFVGGASASSFSLPQTEWFGAALGELSRILGIVGWVDVRSMMRDLPWSEEIVGVEWRAWWGRCVEEFKT